MDPSCRGWASNLGDVCSGEWMSLSGGDADVRAGRAVTVRAAPVWSSGPKCSGVRLGPMTSRLGRGISGDRGLGDRVAIGVRWSRTISDVLCCCILLVGALRIVTKSSITLREMYDPGIGARLKGDTVVLGFILVIIISPSLLRPRLYSFRCVTNGNKFQPHPGSSPAADSLKCAGPWCRLGRPDDPLRSSR